MNNVIFITGQHGDEQVPVIALASKGIPQIVANPKALSLGKRFFDCDLNNSFGVKLESFYEHNRAKDLLNIISSDKIIVDFHTFSTESEPFVIIVDKKMIEFAKKTGLKNIVLMSHNIKNGHAFINYRNGISVEVGKHNSYDSFLTTLKIAKNITSKKQKKQKIILYSVFDVIRKPGKYINFKKHKDGFIPVLAGEKAYNFYGLKARKINLIKE